MLISISDSISMSPVAAYDALAPYYGSVVAMRKPYLSTIEDIIVSQARGARSLLDIGSGDGVRALSIARAGGIESLVLVEPSAGMRAQCPEQAQYWSCEASQIPATGQRFDLITCLWNTLGHLQNTRERVSVLTRLKPLLSPAGSVFVDVNHRYNAPTYGWARTALRILRDLFSPAETNGDVVASWQAGGQSIRTRGHVFTHPELLRIFNSAGLRIKTRWIVDYQSGARRKFSLRGNLLYQLTP